MTAVRVRPVSRLLRRLAAAVAILAGVLAAPAPAAAAPFTVGLTEAAPLAAPEGNTGASRYSAFRMTFAFDPAAPKVRRLSINLPRGASGAISNAQFCPIELFRSQDLDACPEVSRVGKIDVNVIAHLQVFGAVPFDYDTTASGHIVSLAPQGTEAARLGMVYKADAATEVKHSETAMRLNHDYSTKAEPQSDLTTHTCGIQPLPIPLPVVSPCADITVKTLTLTLFGRIPGSGGKGFFFNPARCDRPLQTGVTAWAYDGDGPYSGSQAQDSKPLVPITGCDDVGFAPSVEMRPASAAAASSQEVAIGVRQSADPTSPGIAPPFDSVTMHLPDGLSLTPSTNADGRLEACTDEKFAVHVNTPASCPAGAQVGHLEVESPMVRHMLPGKIYLALPEAGDGEAIARLFMVAEAGDLVDDLRVKFAARVIVDPQTGRLTATLADLPPQPVREIFLTFRGGAAPTMRQPRVCGTTHAVGLFRSTAQPDGVVEATAPYTVDRNCDLAHRFEPVAGLAVTPAQAAAPTALTAAFAVPGGHQSLSAMRLTMPPGLLGQLTASALCPVGVAQAGGCGDDALIGHALAQVGVPGAPFSVRGTVHMTEGFDGSIAGLLVSLPAKVGPIDLGMVRTLARIDLVGTDLRMQVSAQVPTQVAGVPLDLSHLAITIDRPGVVLNPSQCGGGAALGEFTSLQGGAAQAGAPLQVGGCEALAWAPGFGLDLAGQVGDKGRPDVTIAITQPAGQGNLRHADVTLPAGISTDLKNINARICESAAAAAAGACPPHSTIGSVAIDTPALPGPVHGRLVIVRVPGQVLPGLMVHVRDRIALDLVGAVTIDRQGRIRTVFDGTPDAPIRTMVLAIRGGADGILQLAGDELCAGATSDVALSSHHGALVALRPRTSCDGRMLAAAAKNPSQATTTYSRSKGLRLTLKDPNGIKRITLRLPKGSVFHKRAAKRVKVKPLGGVKAKVKITNDRRKLRITITPRKKSQKVTRVSLRVPAKATKINAKVKKLMAKSKKSKAKRRKELTKLLTPTVHLTDVAGKTRKAAVKLKVSGIR